MTFDHYGTAELLDGNGQVVDTVPVHLQFHPPIGSLVASWGGQIQMDRLGPGWTEVTRMRLANGAEADVFVSNHKVRSTPTGIRRTGLILGSGAIPF
jgi:hypothetical protein